MQQKTQGVSDAAQMAMKYMELLKKWTLIATLLWEIWSSGGIGGKCNVLLFLRFFWFCIHISLAPRQCWEIAPQKNKDSFAMYAWHAFIAWSSGQWLAPWAVLPPLYRCHFFAMRKYQKEVCNCWKMLLECMQLVLFGLGSSSGLITFI